MLVAKWAYNAHAITPRLRPKFRLYRILRWRICESARRWAALSEPHSAQYPDLLFRRRDCTFGPLRIVCIPRLYPPLL